MIGQGARGGKLTVLIRRLKSWRRRRALAQTHIQLTALRQGALSAQDDMSRDYLIVSANALLGDLQARVRRKWENSACGHAPIRW